MTRLLPEVPLPPYGYVPGLFPHPIRDPAGHSYRAADAADARAPAGREAFDPEAWQRCTVYLRACDLFNNGYYWEAHEEWEQIWQAAGRRGTVADFLKALIKLAAAGVKVREGNAAGVARHATRAGELLEQVAGTLGEERDEFAGVSLAMLRRHAAEVARRGTSRTRIGAGGDGPVPCVEVVFEWVILPGGR